MVKGGRREVEEERGGRRDDNQKNVVGGRWRFEGREEMSGVEASKGRG